MSVYVAVTALQLEDHRPARIAEIFDLLENRGHEQINKELADRESGENEVCISSQAERWLTILYPNAFRDGYGCARLLSEAFNTLAFDFEVWNGETWWYSLMDRGRLLDIFWEQPRYFEGRIKDEQISPDTLEMRSGRPDIVANATDVSSMTLQPYYDQLDDSDLRILREQDPDGYRATWDARKKAKRVKAHPDDKHRLHTRWSFTDFAGRLGIHYPTSFETSEKIAFYGLRPNPALEM